MRYVLPTLAVALALVWGLYCGYRMGRAQGVNDLIDAGFVVIDPEGYPVAEFYE